MRFRHQVKNRRVIRVVIATLMAFLMTLSSGHAHHKQSYNNNSNKQVKSVQTINHVKLDSKQKYHTGNNAYMKQGKRMRVGATAYTNDPITSTGTKPTEGRTIAVDPKIIPYGTKVYIPQFDRVFIAEDCGSAIKGNRIDIYMDDYDRCMDWGFKTIDIYILNN